MTFRASLLFTTRLLFPRTDKKSAARHSLLGALLCIGISLIPLVVVLTISNGMIQGITERIIGLSSSHIQVRLRKSSEYLNSVASLEEYSRILGTTDAVISSYAEVQSVALASSTKGRIGAAVRAVPPEVFESNPDFISLFTVKEGISRLPEKNSAVIGAKIAESLQVHCGDTIRLITGKTSDNGTTIPVVTPFTVVGIVSCGYQELDALWVFVPLERGFRLISSGTSIVTIKLSVENPFDPSITQVQDDLASFVGSQGRVFRWDELNQTEYENFASTKLMLVFIMILIVLVASVNICSALIMLSIERRKEIAILKSVGATNSGITLSFLITGFAIGVGGVCVGVPLGILFAVNINKIIEFTEIIVNFSAKILYLLTNSDLSHYYSIDLLNPEHYLEKIPVAVPQQDLLIIVVGTLVLSLCAAAIPAVRAGRERPLHTLRKV
ncbi:MAG: ABC transporter permease [Treponema sp.]|nr:ABC transporter permease [Treponema sp.]